MNLIGDSLISNPSGISSTLTALSGLVNLGNSDTVNTWKIEKSGDDLVFYKITSVSPTIYTEFFRITG